LPVSLLQLIVGELDIQFSIQKQSILNSSRRNSPKAEGPGAPASESELLVAFKELLKNDKEDLSEAILREVTRLDEAATRLS
jgi:hypothetical protein